MVLVDSTSELLGTRTPVPPGQVRRINTLPPEEKGCTGSFQKVDTGAVS